MTPIKMTPGSNCTVASTAMLLDMTIQDVLDELNWHRPTNDIEYHIQEIHDLFLRRDKCLYTIYMDYVIEDRYGSTRNIGFNIQFIARIMGREALLFTGTHCYAWDGEYVIDPRHGIQQPIITILGDLELALVVR